MSFYYNFANYSILAGCVYVICLILSSFKAENIENNTITVIAKTPLTFGMKVTDSSTVTNIVGNRMTAKNNATFAKTGILVENKSKVTGGIVNNEVGKVATTAFK